MLDIPILYEDNHLLVVNKPAELPTMGLQDESETLLGQCKQIIKQKYNKPGNVFLGVVSRLDARVTGVIVIARTSKAAKRLTDAFRNRDVEKHYWALTEVSPSPKNGTMEDYLVSDSRHRRVHVAKSENADGAKHAVLDYQLIEDYRNASLVQIDLKTGRKHQIRIQFSSRNMPLIGDYKYGSELKLSNGIGLHSRHLAFEHPVRKIPMEFTVDTPKPWNAYLS